MYTSTPISLHDVRKFYLKSCWGLLVNLRDMKPGESVLYISNDVQKKHRMICIHDAIPLPLARRSGAESRALLILIQCKVARKMITLWELYRDMLKCLINSPSQIPCGYIIFHKSLEFDLFASLVPVHAMSNTLYQPTAPTSTNASRDRFLLVGDPCSAHTAYWGQLPCNAYFF